MSAPLQQLLAEQPPTTSGIHEAMARHSESIFEEFKGVLPSFLGKRKLGPFINLTLPNAVTQNSEALLQTIGDLILVYNLRLVSMVSAVRLHSEKESEPKLGALLITADNAKALFQLPWELELNPDRDVIAASRSTAESEIIPRDIWFQLFTQKADNDTKQFAYDRLVDRFGSADELPQP